MPAWAEGHTQETAILSRVGARDGAAHCVRLPLVTLSLTVTRPKEEPEDQAQHWKQHYSDCPNQLLLVRSRALENIDNRPDVSDQNEDAQDAAVSEVHHFLFLPVSVGMRQFPKSFARALTFDMGGGKEGAKQPLGRRSI
jgi:hypothetical protein